MTQPETPDDTTPIYSAADVRDKAQRAGVVYRRVRSVEEAVAAVEEVRGCR